MRISQITRRDIIDAIQVESVNWCGRLEEQEFLSRLFDLSSLRSTDRRFKDENGNPRTEWHNIVAWGKLAEICDRYVTKGKQLYIEGQIRTRTYEQDGQKKYFTEIHMEQMEMLGTKSSGVGAPTARPGARRRRRSRHPVCNRKRARHDCRHRTRIRR